jgi:hypothetical protein
VTVDGNRKRSRFASGGSTTGITCRFDDCFENHDGKAVAWAIMHKALSGDTELARSIHCLDSRDRLWNHWMTIYEAEYPPSLFDKERSARRLEKIGHVPCDLPNSNAYIK